jgi:hypothetical protein
MLQTTWWFHLQGSENPDFLTLKDDTTMLSGDNVHQSPTDVQPFPRGTETPTAWLQKPKNSYCSTSASIVGTIGNGELRILSQNSKPINKFSWTSPVLNFIQGKFHLCPLIKYAFHCIYFHYLAITELSQCSDGICC